jgi:LuxR family maltose regulon positive regulatory protein
LAVSTRARPPLPTPLLRSRGEVVEIGTDDLAMDRHEAQLLFESVDVQFSDDEIDRLVDQTEGWPVGLYLAALASKVGGPASTGFAFRGDDRLVGDYLRAEVFSHLAPSTVEFLTHTSVLDHLCGPLCDAVLGARGSQAMLEMLEASNLLLVPLDRHREWYRYHRLFRDVLVAELRRNEPDLLAELHIRAAQWLEANRMPAAAIGHAQSAGDAELVARLVTRAAQPAYAAGRATTIRSWFEWFRTDGSIERFPNVAVLGGLFESLRGRPASAERWAMAAETGVFEDTLPDGSSIGAWRAFLRALTAPAGVAQMRADARLAYETLGSDSPFRTGALVFEALSLVMEGDLETADPIFAHAIDLGEDLASWTAAAVALAERALVAVARQDWDDARTLAARAVTMMEAHDEYLEAAVVHVAAARIAVHDSDPGAAREHLARAARLRPLLTYAVPFTAHFELEMARAYLELADPSGARTVLRGMRDTLRQRPSLGILHDEAKRLEAELDTMRHGSIGASSLTVAELRVLPYLSTHLSFREIGERLYVSRHTVKTQAISVYRKLGVASRSEAIARAQEIGLLAS